MLFQAQKQLIFCSCKAWTVGISITTQYDNIYVIIEQFVTLAKPLIHTSSDRAVAFF